MNFKKLITCVIVSAMVCGSLASCGDKEKKKKNTDPKGNTEVTDSADKTETTTENQNVKIEGNNIDLIAQEDEEATTKKTEEEAEAPVFDNGVEAESGDAFLALNCDDWWVQYWGEKTDPLCYNAGVQTIDGNGQYTVSLTAETQGFRYAMTNSTDESFTPSGVGFAAVLIKDGASVCPNAVITIDSITVNGEPIELTKKNYTNTEGGNIRANIYNEWVSEDSIPADAKTVNGPLYENGAKSAINDGSYAATIADKDKFANWTDISVTFTVSGLDYDKYTVPEQTFYDAPAFF